MRRKQLPLYAFVSLLSVACSSHSSSETGQTAATAQDSAVIQPVVITDTVRHDTDDPAIWINPADPGQSLIIGTDKDRDGALYVFDLNGKIQSDKVVRNLKRPNNVDVAYGLLLGGKPVDIAVVTEREANQIRIFRLPDLKPVDGGGIAVFTGETQRAPMGISLYTRPSDHAIFAVVGRKDGPKDGYLWQYRLEDNGSGQVKATVVRKFGMYSKKKEIESIAVDNELGYVYYSDEQVGVRKYYADPDSSGRELALFAQDGFKEDNEGISIYKTGAKTGYILVSDQGANQFHFFPREGTADDPHHHPRLKTVRVAAQSSDGSEVTSLPLGPKFPKGLFVAMSEGKVFHLYRWEDLMDTDH
ncbi:phytase [Larkinella harenae]